MISLLSNLLNNEKCHQFKNIRVIWVRLNQKFIKEYHFEKYFKKALVTTDDKVKMLLYIYIEGRKKFNREFSIVDILTKKEDIDQFG